MPVWIVERYAYKYEDDGSGRSKIAAHGIVKVFLSFDKAVEYIDFERSFSQRKTTGLDIYSDEFYDVFYEESDCEALFRLTARKHIAE